MGTRVLRAFNVSLSNKRTIKTCFQKCCKVPARPPPYCDAEQKQKIALENLQRLWRPHTSSADPQHHATGAAQFLSSFFSHNCCQQKPLLENI